MMMRSTLVLAGVLLAASCVDQQRVLSSEDAGVHENTGVHRDAGMHMPDADAEDDAGVAARPPIAGVQDVIASADGAGCARTPSEIAYGLDRVNALAVTTEAVYVATYSALVRSDRDGSHRRTVRDIYAEEILADDHTLFFTSDGAVHAVGNAGENTIEGPEQGSILGLSQDADAVYAVDDEALVRIAKANARVTRLAGADTGAPVNFSRTAVDGDFVYFIAQLADEQRLDLERVRKDGTQRETLATDISDRDLGLMAVQLLVDLRYVYIAGYGEISRVPITGGDREVIAPNVDVGLVLPPAIAQDDRCLYFYSDHALRCSSKVDDAQDEVFSLSRGRIAELAIDDHALYFAVDAPTTYLSPAIRGENWVGRVSCPAPK
jgi:hypothetical protein